MRTQWLRNLIPALSLAALPVFPTVSHAGIAVGVSINIAPPVLPVYVQPALPAPGYIWSPGYWAYGDDGYYWVPGTWVLPPEPGLLWTPGYWGWAGGAYLWHGGYWGPHVGFYGGVNYGFGYGGVGFEGGYWRGGSYFYNRSVVNVGSVHVTNVYNRTVVYHNDSHVAFNGPGGIRAHATGHELAAEREHHFEATSSQRDHEHAAFGNRELHASFNHGRPAVAATSRPGEFSGRGVVAARGSGPRGGAAHDVAHNAGPGGRGPENHGGSNGGGHGAPGGEGHGAPGGGHADPHPVARNDVREGGHPAGSAGGGAPRGSAGEGAPHSESGGGAPRGNNPGGGAPHSNVGGGAPHGGNPGGGAPHMNAGGGAPHGSPGGAPRGNPGGGAPHGNFGGGAPRGGNPGAGVPHSQPGAGAPRGNPGGGGAPHVNAGGGAPHGNPGGGAPRGNPGGGGHNKPEGHR